VVKTEDRGYSNLPVALRQNGRKPREVLQMRRILIGLLVAIVITSVGFGQILPRGVPREKTLILPYLWGPGWAPGNWNIWAGWRNQNMGLHQFVTDALWTINPNVVEGGVINALAAEPPIYNEDFTQITIKLREGIYWSDGVPFTADDVVFTILTVRDTPGLQFQGWMQDVEDAYAVDDYTVVVKLKKPNTRFHVAFLERWHALRPMPKHIFEKVDNVSEFDFHPPVSLGPYVYADHDPAGYWVLWRLREDWGRTVTGKLFGKPTPEYVLFINYGPAEKEILAMLKHELDVVQGTSEQLITLLKRGAPYTRSYRKDYPYSDPRDISVRGGAFNHLVYPYNIKDVRWALALAIDIVEYSMMAYEGMAAMSFAFPLVVNDVFYEWYFKPLLPWLENLTLDLGNGQTFKPWDPEAPWRVAELAKKMGYKLGIDLKDEKTVRLTFGYGWWEYAPNVAETLLKKHGFYRGPDGMWRLPGGTKWNIKMPCAPDPTSMDYIFPAAVAEQWKKFGISVELFPSPMAGHFASYGEFDVHGTGHGEFVGEPLGLHPDLYRCFNPLHSKFVRPVGESTLGWRGRWSDPRMDQIIEEMELVPWDDEQRIIELGLEGLKIEIEEMIGVPLLNTPILIVFDNYYWTNWPSPENDYARCDNFTTWPQLKYILHHLKPTGRK
jgi:peptide/nickel transport system substrate-binding protein